MGKPHFSPELGGEESVMAYERRRYPDAFAFLADCEEDLMRFEVEHSLLLGLADNLVKDLLCSDDGTFFGSVWRDGHFEAAFLRSGRGRAMVCSQMSEDCARWLSANLGEKIDEVQGLLPSVQVFAEAFAPRRSLGLNINMYQGLYRIDEVDGHYPFEGEGMVSGRGLPQDLLQTFAEQFLVDCFPSLRLSASARAREIIERHLKQDALFAWRNAESEIVAIAARSRQSANGATISLVYTPEAHRRRGYAGRLVAALSRKILSDGKRFCTLYTDLRNPTSNSVYRKVGFRKVAESWHCSFWERMD
ncbi:MAG: GNAT family N-acetyltransferase [Bdellovibrionota bacterium]